MSMEQFFLNIMELCMLPTKVHMLFVLWCIEYCATVRPLYNADGGFHRVERVIAKPPYNEGVFKIVVLGKVLQWEPRGYHVISESAL